MDVARGLQSGCHVPVLLALAWQFVVCSDKSAAGRFRRPHGTAESPAPPPDADRPGYCWRGKVIKMTGHDILMTGDVPGLASLTGQSKMLIPGISLKRGRLTNLRIQRWIAG